MAKQAAYGTHLIYTDPESPVTRAIHAVADISGPEVSIDTIDVTTHDSPDKFNEFVPGMADGGEVTFDLMFDPLSSGHARILELVALRKRIFFIIEMPGPDSIFVGATSSEFTPGQTGWTTTGLWAIDTANGKATCNTGTLANDTLKRTISGLTIAEYYTVSIKSLPLAAGPLQVKFNGVIIAPEFAVSPSTLYKFRFMATVASGLLEIIVPTGGGGSANIILDSVQVSGFNLGAREEFTFAGIFTKAGATFPTKDALKASCTIKVSGKPLFGLP